MTNSQAIALILLCFSVSFQLDADVQFTDVASEAGIRFKHHDGRSGRHYFLETLGSGAAFWDYDNDDDLDVYLVNAADLPGISSPTAATNALYRNNGNGAFTDVTAQAGVGDTGYGVGCAVGDYDNDGFVDLYVTNFGANVLYHNNGDGTLTNVAAAAGVADNRWGASCAFADYDRDGYLDLYVTNYVAYSIEAEKVCQVRNLTTYCDPRAYPGTADILYHNNGDGTFDDVTRAAGVYYPQGRGLGVAFSDYDDDGDLDFYVANDATQNFLYHNNGDGTFSESSLLAGVGFSEDGRAESGMGTDFGDYDNDGRFDLIVTNFQNELNTLYHNDGAGLFSDVSYASGIGEVSLRFLGWGVSFFDYDNDGDQDVFVTNGHVHDNIERFDDIGSYAQLNHIYCNEGQGRFTVTSDLGTGLQLCKVGRGAAFGDYDNDGDIDILISNSNQTADLLRNDGENQNHWLLVQLIGTESNRSAIGARVTVVVGEISLVDEVRSGNGFASGHDLRLHFGLGTHVTVDQLHVRWPNGLEEHFGDIAADCRIVIMEGKGLRKRR